MIKVKHLMARVQPTDGERIWVEPIGLTRDLVQWCRVDHVIPEFGPSRRLWNSLKRRGHDFQSFCAAYHQELRRNRYAKALRSLVIAARDRDITLLHASDDSLHNSAVGLYQYLLELDSYCHPDSE